MKVIVKRPFDPIGYMDNMPNTLEALQYQVDGYIEAVTVRDGLVIICNEEGKLVGMQPNFKIGSEQFVGTCIVVGTDGEEFCDVPIELGDWVEMLIEWGNEV